MNQDKNVVIVDYGMGNLFNLYKALIHVGANPVISQDPKVVANADHLVLPGVGAFGDGMAQLKEKKLQESILTHVDRQKPLLGICLGMQLLMTESYEHGKHQGLNIVPGQVIRFKDSDSAETFYKIPHVGWNSLNYPVACQGRDLWDNTIFKNLLPGAFLYFVHSFTVVPQGEDVILSVTEYGQDRFCSALQQGSVYGCQFHPELSGTAGLKILQQFLTI